jgi:glutaredoxin 3
MLLSRVVAPRSVRGFRSWFRQTDMGSSESLLASKEADFINEAVKENCVVVFSKTTCGYCRMAKKVFEDIGTPYMAVELNNRDDGGRIQSVLQAMTGESTVRINYHRYSFNL